MDPITASVLSQIGSQMISKFLGSVFGDTSASEGAAMQMTGIGQQLIPQ